MWLLLIDKRIFTILFQLKLYHKLTHLLLLISFVEFSFAAVFSLVSFCFITAAHQGLHCESTLNCRRKGSLFDSRGNSIERHCVLSPQKCIFFIMLLVWKEMTEQFQV
jgi:hypothetical protein